MTAPATAEAARWEGWGTALKTLEPWALIRKPLDGTVAENIMKYGVGALNIDACRLPETQGRPNRIRGPAIDRDGGVYDAAADGSFTAGSRADGETQVGRWPSAFICSDTDVVGPATGVAIMGDLVDEDLDGVLGAYTKHFRIGEHVITAIPDELLSAVLPTVAL